MYKKAFIISLVALLLGGCVDTSLTLPLPKSYYSKTTLLKTDTSQKPTSTGFYQPITYKNEAKLEQKKVIKTTKELNFHGNGYIKGIVEKVYFSKSKHRWIYHIKGLDVANGKLDYAKVYATKKIAKLHEYIYAIIEDGIITSSYIYTSTKSYTFKKKSKFINKSKQKIKIHKKVRKTPANRQRKQLISAPKIEEVTF